MIVIKVPKEIKNYKEKVIGNFTLRQIIWIAIACAIAIGVYNKCRPYVGDDCAGTLCIFAVIPAGLMGFYTKNGQPIEKYFLKYLKYTFNYEKVRTMKSRNFWDELIEQATEEEEKLKSIRKKKGVRNGNR